MVDKDKEAADKKAAHHDNPSQDPNHPMNKTPAAKDPRVPHDGNIDGPVYARENLMTEQEKGPLDPVSPSEVTPGPVETIEAQGIGPRTPYPEGDPPPPSETTVIGQGIKGLTDKPNVKPGEVKKPAPTREPIR